MEKNKISYSQLLFTVICYIQSFALLTSFSFAVAGRNNWLAVPIGIVIAAIFLIIQLSIMKNIPGKVFFKLTKVYSENMLGLAFQWYICFIFSACHH